MDNSSTGLATAARARVKAGLAQSTKYNRAIFGALHKKVTSPLLSNKGGPNIDHSLHMLPTGV